MNLQVCNSMREILQQGFPLRQNGQRGAALVLMSMVMAMIGILAIGFMQNYIYETSAVMTTMRNAQSLQLSESALALMPSRLSEQNYSDMQVTLFNQATVIGTSTVPLQARNIWNSIGNDIFTIADPNLQAGELYIFLDNDVRPTSVTSRGRLIYTKYDESSTKDFIEDRDITASIEWLTRNFEYALFLGDFWRKQDVVFSFGSSPGTSGNDSISGGMHVNTSYIEGNASVGLHFSSSNPNFSLGSPRTKTPLGLDAMNYSIRNHTHYVDVTTIDNPDFQNKIDINPIWPPDWRWFLYDFVGPQGYTNVFFGSTPEGPVRQSKPLNLGVDRVYYVNGHVWFLDSFVQEFIVSGRATIIAKGNIFIYNDIVYQNPDQDMLVLIALGDRYRFGTPIRYGNIFVSDWLCDNFYGTGRVSRVDAFMFAARDFYYNVDMQEFFVTKRIRYNVDPNLHAPLPLSGLQINGGLSVQGLGAGYQQGDRNRRRVAPYIRRDIYSWRDSDGNHHYSNAFFDNATNPGLPVWYGQGSNAADASDSRHDYPWSTAGPSAWYALDGSGSDPCDNSTGSWVCTGADNWAYDDNATIVSERLRFKYYDSTACQWFDHAGNTNVTSPVTHIPFIINYDNRISGISQPPGLPEDQTNEGSIANVHLQDLVEVPRGAGTWGAQ